MGKIFNNKNYIGALLIILVWFINISEDFNIPLWQRLTLGTLQTLILVMTFHVSKHLYRRIQQSKSRQYSLVIVYLTISVLASLTNYIFIDPLEEVLRQEESYLSILFFDVVMAVPIAIVMVFSWAFYQFDRNKENELAISRLTALNKESELNELKKQLNPHFLFNALSNIYSIAYLKDEETPDKIMQLSKMLRYVIYDTNIDFIELSKEIEYLEYYIDFQKFKIRKEQQINFDFSGANGNLKIAPLLLLPFIENAFKHSQVAVEPDSSVTIKLWTEENIIHFMVKNSISKQTQPQILNNRGIGLENIKKRLDLIYKSEAELNIKSETEFEVYLKIIST